MQIQSKGSVVFSPLNSQGVEVEQIFFQLSRSGRIDPDC